MRDLQILDIGGAALVQDDEIDRQALQPPVFVGAQQLADDAGILDLVDAHQHDRQVARDALRPQRRRRRQAAPDRVGRRAQRRVGIEDVARQALVEAGLGRADVEMAQLHLRLRPGERGGALEGVGVLVLVDRRRAAPRARTRPSSRRRSAPCRRPGRAGAGAARTPDRAPARRCWTGAVRRSRRRRCRCRCRGRGSGRGRSRPRPRRSPRPRRPPDGRPTARARPGRGDGASPGWRPRPADTRSARRAWRRPGARHRPPAARARSRHRR